MLLSAQLEETEDEEHFTIRHGSLDIRVCVCVYGMGGGSYSPELLWPYVHLRFAVSK